MSWLATAQKSEQWVVAEIAKGWQTAKADALGIFNYVAQHQQQIDAALQAALTGVQELGALDPAAAPAVLAATAAIDASTKVIDTTAAAINNGSVPMQQLTDTFHSVKDTQTAVNTAMKALTAKPSAPPKAAS